MLSLLSNSRRDPSKGSLIARGVAYLALLGVVAGLLVAQFRGVFDDVIHVHARVISVGDGLQIGADVKYHGKSVGEVTHVVAGDLIDLDLAIDRHDAEFIPAAVTARVLPSSLFGNTQVQLVSRGRTSGSLSDGQLLKVDRSQRTLELQDALNSVSNVLAAASPAQIDAILGAAAESLRGRGDQLGRTIVRLDGYLSAVLDHLPRLEQDIKDLARAVRIVDGATPDLLAAMRASLTTVGTLRELESEIRDAIDGGTQVLDVGAGFMEANDDRIIRLVRSLAQLVAVAHAHRSTIGPTITNVELTLKRWADLMEGRSYLPLAGYIGGVLDRGYTAADCPRYGSLAGPNCRAATSVGQPGPSGAGSTSGGNAAGGHADANDPVGQSENQLLNDLGGFLGGLLGGGQ